ncbi:MAG TPA: hypothetical protein VFP43_04180 [Mesorhizobium sp.]|nr:hypothetical protein [Mesorhizobium sp.]
MTESDAFDDIENLRLLPDRVRTITPQKILKRREHFIRVPFSWLERLDGAAAKVYALALHLRYLHWRNKGRPFTLANGMLRMDGISRSSKWRGLAQLERRGMITIEHRDRKSPVITVHD